MKPAPFEYVAPRSLEDALAELARGGEDAKPLAGGQSLVPLLNMRLARPSLLVADIQMPAAMRSRRASRFAMLALLALLVPAGAVHGTPLRTCKRICGPSIDLGCPGLRKGKLKKCRTRPYRQDIPPGPVEQDAAAKACVPHAPPVLSASLAPRTIVPRSGPRG